MSNEMNKPNKQISWNALMHAVEAEKCVLCIGQGVFTNAAGQKLEDQIQEYLKEQGEIDEDIICYPEGLFYFRRGFKRNNVVAAISRFYKQAFPMVENIYEKLVEIPFNLILFLTPDQLYADVSEKKDLPVRSDFYLPNMPSRMKEKPTGTNPIAYNLFGSFRNDESIMLTYDDLFNFLQSTIKGKSMSENMRATIKNARHFICLGISFDKWYMQLLLRVLEIHSNKQLTKYAASDVVPKKEIKDFYEDQFEFTFVDKDV
jgi:hypothetical protein